MTSREANTPPQDVRWPQEEALVAPGPIDDGEVDVPVARAGDGPQSGATAPG